MNTDITKQMEMLLYRTEDDNVTVSALIKDETIWLTQKAMAELFGIDKSGIRIKRRLFLPIITIWMLLFPLVTELTPFRQPDSVYGQPEF